MYLTEKENTIFLEKKLRSATERKGDINEISETSYEYV